MKIAPLLAIAACASAPPHRKRSDALIDASNGGDIGAIEKLVRKPVANGGMWFGDMACAQEFSAPGTIEGDGLSRFARCLAGLHVQHGARKDQLSGVAVLTYGPGMEIEARFLEDDDGPWLAWIGFVGRANLHDSFPTITPEAFEALRTSGHPNGDLDDETAAALLGEAKAHNDTAEGAFVKVCIDRNGAVVSAHVREASSLRAASAFAASARTWTFRPFEVDGGTIPICAEVPMVYPPSAAKPDRSIPPTMPDDTNKLIVVPANRIHRISGERGVVPAWSTTGKLAARSHRALAAQYAVCIDETGAVASVAPIRASGVAEYDAALAGTLRGWRYSPYEETGKATPVCSVVTFHYSSTASELGGTSIE